MQAKVDNRVQELRRKKKITQQDLAHSVGVTRQTIIAIEKGNYVPSVGLAIRISQFFNKHVDEIFILQ